MELSELAKRSTRWLTGKAPDSDIVISTRIRLARNLSGYPFTTQATDEQKMDIVELVQADLQRIRTGEEVSFIDLDKSESIDRKFLVERHLISREIADREGSRGVAFTPQERLSLMINEEDHIRLSYVQGGLALWDVWDEINRFDDALSERLPFAYHAQYGYLTACPTNLGTGMRVSVMMHLPALVLTQEIEKVFRAVTKINLVVRGLYGEGTQASGDFYQISNQVTLGLTEEEIVRRVEAVAGQVIRYERLARETLLRTSRVQLEDRIWRAYGLLRHARSISSEETMTYLSTLRLGVNIGLVSMVPIDAVNELFFSTQPAHIQKLKGEEMPSDARNVVRARMIRDRLSEGDDD